MNKLRGLLLCIGLLFGTPANAWWEYGHESVAAIAMHEVRPATRLAIRRLLARSALLETPACPARTIEQASVWPDCIKTLGDRFSYAYSWHYQNVDICKPFDLTSACANGDCVSKQIDRAARMLKDRTLPVRDRIEALAFLIHFVGDLHMPLHAGDRGDKGGNAVAASYGVMPHTNLHSIWDGLLADRAISTPPAGALGILSQVPARERAEMAGGTTVDWSRESWLIAHDVVYASVFGDPCGAKPVGPVAFGTAQVEAQVPVLRRQIARGGLRLARLLDEALG